MYSRFDGKLEFVTKLKNDIKVFQWMKIEPADESPANDVPTVDGSAILWDYQVTSVFRFYVLTTFNAIGFTLFINREIVHKPLRYIFLRMQKATLVLRSRAVQAGM